MCRAGPMVAFFCRFCLNDKKLPPWALNDKKLPPWALNDRKKVPWAVVYQNDGLRWISPLSFGGFGASSAAPPSAPAVSGSFAFVVQDEGLDEKESDSDIVILLQDSTLDAERKKDILMRVSASSTGLQVRAGVLSELKRRGARKKLQRLCYLGKDLKDDDVVGAVQSPWGYAHTVICMCLAKDTGDEAAAAQADAIFDRKADAIVARVAAKLRAEMTQLLSLSQGVAVA